MNDNNSNKDKLSIPLTQNLSNSPTGFQGVGIV